MDLSTTRVSKGREEKRREEETPSIHATLRQRHAYCTATRQSLPGPGLGRRTQPTAYSRPLPRLVNRQRTLGLALELRLDIFPSVLSLPVSAPLEEQTWLSTEPLQHRASQSLSPKKRHTHLLFSLQFAHTNCIFDLEPTTIRRNPG